MSFREAFCFTREKLHPTPPRILTLIQLPILPYAGLPSRNSLLRVSFPTVHFLISSYFSTNKSLTSLPNTTLPHAFKCVVSSGLRLYFQLASGPIALQYLSLARLRSIQRESVCWATEIVALRSLARDWIMRGGEPVKDRRVRGVRRMGVAFTARTSETRVARLTAYWEREMLAAGFWSLWPNYG